MNFDRWWMEESETSIATDELPLVPDGEHVAKVVKAKFKDLAFKKSDQNEHGTSLVVELEVTGYRPVEAIVPAHFRGMVEAVCRAASVATPKKGEDWDESCLVDQFVRIATLQGVGKTGREYVRIEKWIPGRQPLPEAITKAPPRAKPAKKDKTPDDDIPF